MSNRTAIANKAVADAWENERKLLEQGKGTRNWTKEQQQDILNFGRAKDENGKAYEGHHMQSVEKYPESQADPLNIQFLSRQEHKEAHGGNFQNPTNGYFDPVLKKTFDFGDGSLIPCKIIDLSNPVIKIGIDNLPKTEIDNNPNVKQTKIDMPSPNKPKYNIKLNQVKKTIKKASEIGWDSIINGAKKATDFYNQHKSGVIVIAVVSMPAGVLGIKKAPELLKKISKSDMFRNESNTTTANEIISDVSDKIRKSPILHQVSGHFQNYNGVKKWVEPYLRGGKN